MIAFTVPGEPVPKRRPRKGQHGNFYTPRESARYEDAIAWESRRHRPMKGLLGVGLVFRTKRSSDIDNLCKAALDGLQKGGLIPNDRDVVELKAWRIPPVGGAGPQLEIEIWNLDSGEGHHGLQAHGPHVLPLATK